MRDPRPSGGYFDHFAPPIREPSPLRAAITAAYRLPETECVPALAQAARLPEPMRADVSATARTLITALRSKKHGSVVEELVQEYALSSQEGVALMCLAEALLRIPDNDTRDALIRDKISDGNWAGHIGGGRSLFVNAATWGLVVTGRLVTPVSEGSLGGALTRLLARAGEPVIRRGVDMAMRMMGEQFVMGETIAEALDRAEDEEEKGFTYSYDMLGEAAMTAGDAARYFAAYETAIHAIGKAAAGRGIYDGPGISIKLSALHPRYSRSQAERVMAELLPRAKALAVLARSYDIGLNIDAEEADRLELSLDILESLCADPDLAGWNGMGFVVQAYGKRCPHVIDFVIDLARRTSRRIMVRLVKGAYWDAEIKRAQVDGLDGYPVFTRKVYSDVSYIAAARKLLAAPDAVFPQFATHNAQTVAAIYHIAGRSFRRGDYEFQCLHGMGEPLYEEVIAAKGLNRPCRIYAPVGTHETLLAYLVRRLLENGANSSFVNRIADDDVPVESLIADPVEEVLAMPVIGAQHPAIRLPRDIFTERTNSAGLDLSNEATLAALGAALADSAAQAWEAAPEDGAGERREVANPADAGDIVGTVTEASDATIANALSRAELAAEAWRKTPVQDRAAALLRAADAMQAALPVLLGLIMREAGKSAPNAIAEVREAIDFLRYYANEANRLTGVPHGPIACISPWNFPLAIFTGQIAAALAAGNPVLAKPAEETPLIAAEGVRILHAAGIPGDVLQLLPGDGRVGAALVASPAIQGVMFTGSTDVARLIQRTLAQRLSPKGEPIPLIAETGGQNAMIVDSSALPEQVVADVLASAFDSAGQRCSALRILCLQDDIADKTLSMLKAAMAELDIGATDALHVDVGPVISAEAKATIDTHIAAMRARKFAVHQAPLPEDAARGTFVAPTIIEIGKISDVKREVFGPVLHVLRYDRDDLDTLIDAINATGYGLTFGLHTRIDETIAHVSERIEAGNIYVNRNIIGAVVGVQPFGGRGLSGTGPKAGGPLYLPRLTRGGQTAATTMPVHDGAGLAGWLKDRGMIAEADAALRGSAAAPQRGDRLLEGPVGEENRYRLERRGRIYLAPLTRLGLFHQLGMVLATGNRAAIDAGTGLADALDGAPGAIAAQIDWVASPTDAGPIAGALIEGDGARTRKLAGVLAATEGALVPVQAATTAALASGVSPYRASLLIEEVSISTNTTAAGGNANLMTLS